MLGAPEYEITGVIREVLPAVRYGRGKTKQQFILLTDTPSPQILPIEVREGTTEQLREIPLHAKVRVRFALEGQMWHPPQGAPRPIVRLVAVGIYRLPD